MSKKSASSGMKCLSRSSNSSTPIIATLLPRKNSLFSGSKLAITLSTVGRDS